ncbi:hypothetical protein V6N13_001412 [Hibiscus sabdariffa]
MAMEDGGGALVLSETVLEEEEWRDIVKENSWEGEEDGEGGDEAEDTTSDDADDCCLSAEPEPEPFSMIVNCEIKRWCGVTAKDGFLSIHPSI